MNDKGTYLDISPAVVKAPIRKLSGRLITHNMNFSAPDLNTPNPMVLFPDTMLEVSSQSRPSFLLVIDLLLQSNITTHCFNARSLIHVSIFFNLAHSYISWENFKYQFHTSFQSQHWLLEFRKTLHLLGITDLSTLKIL